MSIKIKVMIALLSSIYMACEDEIMTRRDGGPIRDQGVLSDLGEAGSNSTDVEVAGLELDDGFASEEADGMSAGETIDLGPTCVDELLCDGEGRLRRCVDGEWIAESCPAGTRCDEESRSCIEMGCAEGVTICTGENSIRECVDGELSAPLDCDQEERCVAGRCVNACEIAAAEADYQGCEFWAIDMDNITDGEGGGPGAASSAVVLSNVSEADAEVTIEDRGGVIVHQRTLSAGETDSFILPRADLTGTHLGGTSWRVTTTQPVLGYLFSPLQRTATSSVDATLLIPVHALDDRYRVLTWPGQGYNQRGTMSIIAVDDEPTTVTVVLPEAAEGGVDFRGEMTSPEHRSLSFTPGLPWTEILDRGEVWNLQSGAFTDLSGTEVIADKDIVLFAGTRCSNIPSGIPRCDHLEHQMLPLRNQGRNYIAPGGLPRAEEETWYRIVATLDGTTISSTPSVFGEAVELSAGETFTFSSSEPLAIEASAPVMVGMFLASADAGAGGLGDPSFVLLPPVEQFQSSYAFLTPNDFERDGLTLIANGEAMVTLDEMSLALSWEQIAESQWRVAHTQIIDGPHVITSDRPIGMITTGYDEEVSYAFTGGLSLQKLRESEPPPFEGVCLGGAALNTPCETGDSGRCSAGRLQCSPGGEPSCVAVSPSIEERCNLVDDDCDGLIDESNCANFILNRDEPNTDRLMIIEEQEETFRVQAQGDAAGLEIEWYIDSDRVLEESGTSFTWTPLRFEEGPHTIKAMVREGDRIAEVSWLSLVNDAASNTPAIYGRVSRPPGTEAMLGLTIDLSDGPSEGESIVDPRGYYSIPAETGRYDLKLDTLFNSAPPGFPRGIIVLEEDVVLGELNERRDIMLPIATVTGVVSKSDGQPLAGVDLVFDGECFACSQRVTTDEMGRYETILFESTWSVDATPPIESGLPTRTVHNEEVSQDRVWDIVFPNIYHIQALVVDQYGEPVPGVTLVFDGSEAEAERETDATGRIEINLPRGEYLVKLDTLFFPRPPHIGKGIVPLINTLSVNANLPEFTIPLPNAWVSGIVTGQADGTPQAQVQLDLDGSCFACSGRAVTDASGAYGVPLLHADYTLELSPPVSSDYVNQQSDSIAAYQDLTHDIVLEGPALVINGTLHDPRGEVVVGVGLKSEGRTESRVTTDAQGHFEFRLLPGNYEFKIDTLFGARPVWGPRGIVEFWSGTVLESATNLYIAPFAWIQGRVQESAGDVVSDAELSFDGSCFACSQTVHSDAAGQYSATLFRGIYSLEVTPPDPLPQQTIENIDCREGEITLDIDY